jgi:hypothetical protein
MGVAPSRGASRISTSAILADQGGADQCSESRLQLVRRFAAAQLFFIASASAAELPSLSSLPQGLLAFHMASSEAGMASRY